MLRQDLKRVIASLFARVFTWLLHSRSWVRLHTSKQVVISWDVQMKWVPKTICCKPFLSAKTNAKILTFINFEYAVKLFSWGVRYRLFFVHETPCDNCFSHSIMRFVLFFREDSTRLVEQSRCLSHLSHVYHSLNQNSRSLMAALQELNAAEEAEENLHEVSSSNIKNRTDSCLCISSP